MKPLRPLTPTETLILAAARSLLTGERPAAPTSADWADLLQLARRHRLVPVLQRQLPAPEPRLTAELEQESRRQRVRTAVMTEDFLALHHQLSQAGIPVMPIKGLALAHAYYPSPTLRYFDDLDLLVPADRAAEAQALVRSLGYQPHPNAPLAEWHHLPPLVHPHHGTLVEIHTDLIRRARPGWRLDDIWRRARQDRLAGAEVWLLAEPDALILLALHARHHLFHRWLAFLDAAWLWRSLSPEAWQSLPALARDAGALTSLAYLQRQGAWFLGLVGIGGQPWDRALTHPRIPATRWRLGLTGRLAGWRGLEPAHRPRSGPVARLLELLLMDSWGDTVRLARRLLVPPPDFVSQGQPSGRPELARRYLRRLGRRTRIALAQLRGLARGR